MQFGAVAVVAKQSLLSTVASCHPPPASPTPTPTPTLTHTDTDEQVNKDFIKERNGTGRFQLLFLPLWLHHVHAAVYSLSKRSAIMPRGLTCHQMIHNANQLLL